MKKKQIKRISKFYCIWFQFSKIDSQKLNKIKRIVEYKIEKSSFGEGFDLLENDQFINKYETFEKAQEGFINLYNDIRADDYLDPIKTQEVPYLEFTPEMINTIKSEGVPVAAVKDRETSATRTV